jgi:hypothetical protein
MQYKLICSLVLGTCLVTGLLADDSNLPDAQELSLEEIALVEQIVDDHAEADESEILEFVESGEKAPLTPDEEAAIDAAEDVLESLDIPVDDSLVIKLKILAAVLKDVVGPHWEEHKMKYMTGIITLFAAYIIYKHYNSTTVTITAAA